jgi:glycosyltransferase involved in cell wall biosynthesis
MGRPTICLNMIVKDEAPVIRRCLESVRPIVDRWVIVDTGSSDATRDIVRDVLADLPGELHDRPWRDFGHNRTEALELARGHGDYLFFIDADDVLEFEPGFERSTLGADAYELEIHYAQLVYRRVCLVAARLPWRWQGVLHEYLECGRPFAREVLRGARMHIVGGGARSQVEEREKFARDAAVLESALLAAPNDTRYQFYLAQSLRDAGQLERAAAAYDRRAQMGGFAEEVFCAHLEGARLARRLGRTPTEIIDRYLRAHESRPTRAEALGELAMYLRESGPRWELAFVFAQRAIQIPLPDDVLFVEPEWYAWRCLDEFSIAAYWVGRFSASIDACRELLEKRSVPQTQVGRIRANLGFAEAASGRQAAGASDT